MSSARTANQSRALSEQLLHTLKERVRQRNRQELIDYIDELAPEYTIPVTEELLVDDKMAYRLPELLGCHDEDFIRNIYRCILKREVDFTGLQAGIEALQVERCSRIQLLGRLRYSEEGVRHGVYVRGLGKAYFLARLQKLPVLGSFVSVATNIGTLWNLPSELQWLDAQLRDGSEQLSRSEALITSHLGSSIDKLWGQGKPETLESLIASDAVVASDRSEAEESRPHVALSHVLSLSGPDFVAWCYRRVLSRAPSEKELSEGVESISIGAVSKIGFLGGLAVRAGKSLASVKVAGLPRAYRVDRLESIPVLGFLIKLPRCLYLLSRLDAIVEYQGAQVSRTSGQIVAVEARLMSHYNGSVRQIKREVLDALRSQGD